MSSSILKLSNNLQILEHRTLHLGRAGSKVFAGVLGVRRPLEEACSFSSPLKGTATRHISTSSTGVSALQKYKLSSRLVCASKIQYSTEAPGVSDQDQMAATQRAVHISSFEGGPREWKKYTKLLTDKPIPKAGPGEIVVRMRLRPVNPSDGLSLMGLYGGFQNPGTPGLEGMGEVFEIGDGVEGYQIGQRVTPFLGPNAREGEGSWQEYVKVNSALVIPVADKVSDESAAQLFVNPHTAWSMLQELSPPEGEYVLQTAANSTIGRQVIQLAKHWGMKTINVVRRSSHSEELKALGADEVISSTDEDVAKRVKEITGGRLAHGAMDCVAGETTKMVASCVRGGGKILVYGGATSPDVQISLKDLLFRDVAVQGWWISLYLGRKSEADIRSLAVEIMSLMESGVLEPYSGEKYKLEDYVEAVKKQTTPGRPGKLFLEG